jgi:N-acetylmuramoyl-L-alanine amidase
MPLFQPDSSLVAEVAPTPNFDDRAHDRAPDMILLHYTGMPVASEALDRLCSRESKVSAHYMVFEDGRIVQCVPERLRAWHAGESSWAGESDINSCAIGIEIANPGHDYGYPNFPLRQIAAAIALCRGIIARRGILPERVLAHSDVAPARKRDPGEKFPWKLLHDSGVGHWVLPAPIKDGPRLALGERGEAIGKLQAALAEYGYSVSREGHFDQATADAVSAFQRHFRPARVDGVADSSTLITLRGLLETRPSTELPPKSVPT